VSESINLTITEQETVIEITITEENPITVNFFNIAIPDSRVMEALSDAEAEAAAALASANASAASAVAAAASAIAAADAEATANQNSIINALIFG
jgi:hypothetical protein